MRRFFLSFWCEFFFDFFLGGQMRTEAERAQQLQTQRLAAAKKRMLLSKSKASSV
jgi:hypothetical protein